VKVTIEYSVICRKRLDSKSSLFLMVSFLPARTHVSGVWDESTAFSSCARSIFRRTGKIHCLFFPFSLPFSKNGENLYSTVFSSRVHSLFRDTGRIHYFFFPCSFSFPENGMNPLLFLPVLIQFPG
jgi:hypothetical protein